MRCPYYVKRFDLPTPLYQIWNRDTDQPVNPLYFYGCREDAEAKISAWQATLGEGKGK
jgi:hypothetical protein